MGLAGSNVIARRDASYSALQVESPDDFLRR
jgi:hypothetical protein